MDFSLSDEQRIICGSARSLLAGECPTSLLHSAWEDPDAAQPLWSDHLCDWVGLAEGPLADAALFMEEYGRAAAPGVFLPTLLASFIAVELDETLDGSATVAISGEDGLWNPNGERTKHFVPCAAQAEQWVVVAGSEREPVVAIIPAHAATPVEHMDRGRPLYSVEVGDFPGGRALSARSWERAWHKCLVACAAELVGAGRWLLDTAIAYAGERRQFGRPIGSFQGLQWKLVDAAAELERAGAAVAYAAMCVDASDGDSARAVHCAKMEAGHAARHCARTSLQVHGGIGYTFEYGLHFWLRRAYSGDAFMGPSDYHAARLERLLFAA